MSKEETIPEPKRCLICHGAIPSGRKLYCSQICGIVGRKQKSMEYQREHSETYRKNHDPLNPIKDYLIPFMKCAIGLDREKPYTRRGKQFYKPTRNRYITWADDAIWIELKDAGLADSGPVNRDGRLCYWLTRKGLDWLGEQLEMYIHDEE